MIFEKNLSFIFLFFIFIIYFFIFIIYFYFFPFHKMLLILKNVDFLSFQMSPFQFFKGGKTCELMAISKNLGDSQKTQEIL